ncbi:MAG: hypothetical protein WDZ41_00780 [Candidatus Babeliales bacterium]
MKKFSLLVVLLFLTLSLQSFDSKITFDFEASKKDIFEEKKSDEEQAVAEKIKNAQRGMLKLIFEKFRISEKAKKNGNGEQVDIAIGAAQRIFEESDGLFKDLWIRFLSGNISSEKFNLERLKILEKLPRNEDYKYTDYDMKIYFGKGLGVGIAGGVFASLIIKLVLLSS